MIISMQGNWTVSVAIKNAGFPQQFVVQGAVTGDGTYTGVVGTSVSVTGTQWSISIQSNPGTGWQASQTRLKFPQRIGGNYVFNIESNDSFDDEDFDDLVLRCSTPAEINDFIIYGNVTLYSRRCLFNPCRRFPYVIETYPGLLAALKNPVLRDYIHKYYPERIPPIDFDPNPPDPPYFKPLVFDITGEAMKPKTALQYTRKPTTTDQGNTLDTKKNTVTGKKGLAVDKAEAKESAETASPFAASNFVLNPAALQANTAISSAAIATDKIDLARNIGNLLFPCYTDPGSNLTLTFEEYDRTAAELAGGGYTGTGARRLLGDAITDMNGNYIFRFRFDMSFPFLEDSLDITTGEDVNTVMFPDVIVKIVDFSPYRVVYESAPFYNIPNLKRINLCLPESTVPVTSTCFNGNLIGSLGNVFLGGDQNTAASTATAILRRHGFSNYLEADGKISVNSPLALFNIECAAWAGTIDMRGCMYNTAETLANNRIHWYTIQIMRSTPVASGWQFVSQNHRHPKFSQRHVPGYIGDDVGPFYPNVGGVLNGTVPAYMNIQRLTVVGGTGNDWVNDHNERFMQLNTGLYDVVTGEKTPGTFYVRVDGYDAAGVIVPGATDMIALYIHNKGLAFSMTNPVINDPAVLNAGCGLFRLTDDQLKTPVVFSFQANDPYGFVDHYSLSMTRCPGTSIDLNANIEGNFNFTGDHIFPGGTKLNVHSACPGYKGTLDITDYNADIVPVSIHPTTLDDGDGWIKPGEYFTVYTFSLRAQQRIINGYGGVSVDYRGYGQIMMERLTP